MLSTLLKAKLHLATVTQAELWYDGSCAIDSELLELAGLREFDAARHLAEHRPERGTLHLIFQPAEESAGGGKSMVEEGLLDGAPCDATAMPGVPMVAR